MGRDEPPRPPVGRIPQWVGDGRSRRDISGMSERAVLVMAVDELLRLSSAYEEDKTNILRDWSAFGRKLEALERMPIETIPEARRSSHEWDAMLVDAGRKLSERVKDPRDPMTSDRARAIAREVFDNTKAADDAKAFRGLKSGGLKILLEIAKILIPLAIGLAAGAHHGGH